MSDFLKKVEKVAEAHQAMTEALRAGDIETGMQRERDVMLHLVGLDWQAIVAAVEAQEHLIDERVTVLKAARVDEMMMKCLKMEGNNDTYYKLESEFAELENLRHAQHAKFKAACAAYLAARGAL